MNINIDTIDLYFTNISGLDLLGWRKDKDMYIKKSKSVCYKFYVSKYILVLQFSLSSLQNKYNYIGYDYENSHRLFGIINDDIFNTVGKKLDISNANISRVDINRDFHFDSEHKANEVLNFFKRLPTPRMQKKVSRDSSVEFKTKTKNRIGLRVYRKDLSKNVPKDLKPTVRIEFQICKRKKIIELFGTFNPIKIILNPECTFFAWAQKIKEYRLDKAILTSKWFFSVAKTNSCKSKEKWKEYRKIIEKGFSNQELTASEKAIFQKIMRTMYVCGITPSYSNERINLISKYSKSFFKTYIKELLAYLKKKKNENIKNDSRKSYHDFLYISKKLLDSS